MGKQLIRRTCKSCGTTFCRDKLPVRLFCSSSCYHEFRKKAVLERAIQCIVCGKMFTETHSNRNIQCCSRKCRGISQTKKVELTCKYCEKPYLAKRHAAPKSNFCSHSCRAKEYVKTRGYRKNPNRLTRPTPYEKPGYIKLAGKVRLRDGYRCMKCGKQFIKGSRSLEVHHKIPIREGGPDTMDNLESLCTKCHRQSDMHLRMGVGLPPAGRVKKTDKNLKQIYLFKID